jgi:hypothetical protein
MRKTTEWRTENIKIRSKTKTENKKTKQAGNTRTTACRK